MYFEVYFLGQVLHVHSTDSTADRIHCPVGDVNTLPAHDTIAVRFLVATVHSAVMLKLEERIEFLLFRVRKRQHQAEVQGASRFCVGEEPSRYSSTRSASVAA